MFGFLRPSCPLDIREKTWVELRMQWLIEQVGVEQLRKVEVVTPTKEYFPDDYTRSEKDIRRIFKQVCSWMAIPPRSVGLTTFQGEDPSPVALGKRSQVLGLYERRNRATGRPTVWVEVSQAADPMTLVATIAHELAHYIILGRKWLNDRD